MFDLNLPTNKVTNWIQMAKQQIQQIKQILANSENTENPA